MKNVYRVHVRLHRWLGRAFLWSFDRTIRSTHRVLPSLDTGGARHVPSDLQDLVVRLYVGIAI